MKQIKLMSDYGCFPLWHTGGEIGNIDPASLPISEELKVSLLNWAASYDSILNHEYPPDSRFLTPELEEDFEQEGQRLSKALKAELNGEYQVLYYSQRDGRLSE